VTDGVASMAARIRREGKARAWAQVETQDHTAARVIGRALALAAPDLPDDPLARDIALRWAAEP
jgi:hypothetical protein